MASSKVVHLGLRLPGFPYERISVDNVDLDQDSSAFNRLIDVATSRSKVPADEIVLVYCGRVLNEDKRLLEQGVKHGVTVHVMRKNKEDSEKSPNQPSSPITEENVSQITSMFKHLATSNLWKLSHPRVLVEILEKYPAIREDLGALAILRDPFLLSSMKSAEHLRQMSKQYSILTETAFFIVQKLLATDPKQVSVPDFEDSDSSSSSSSEESPSNNNNPHSRGVQFSLPTIFQPPAQAGSSRDGTTNQITRQQLITALAMAGIAIQEHSTPGIERHNEHYGTDTPAPFVSQQPPPPPSANAQLGIIDSSMLAQAWNQARPEEPVSDIDMTTASSTDVQPSSGTAVGSNNGSDYTSELAQMHEMGLLDDAANLQALQACNGDVHMAINFLFSL